MFEEMKTITGESGNNEQKNNMVIRIGTARITLVCGDITEQYTDAIVNAANSSLMGGGGVDGAIHMKGGQEILEECKVIRRESYPSGLPTGKAVMTAGGKLKAKRVIHTVGPIWYGGDKGEQELLAQAYRNSLALALESGAKTISFPSISTGVYGYPIEKASRVALRAVIGFLEKNTGIVEVRLVLHSQNDLKIYEKALTEIS